MNPLAAILLLVMFVIIGFIAFQIERKRIYQRQGRFSERPSRSINSIYQQHYKNEGYYESDFAHLWITIAQLLHLDQKKLSPFDELKHELGPGKGHFGPSEIDDVIDFLLKECKVREISEDKLEHLKTLDDCVKLICKRVTPH